VNYYYGILITKDLYPTLSFEIVSYIGGTTLYKLVAENATYGENMRKKHLFEILVESLKINKFFFVGIKS
jgi:hypothetical protein